MVYSISALSTHQNHREQHREATESCSMQQRVVYCNKEFFTTIEQNIQQTANKTLTQHQSRFYHNSQYQTLLVSSPQSLSRQRLLALLPSNGC